ncbi:MAG: F0F1 ATP synthase subunit delta [Propionicimonas sp.]
MSAAVEARLSELDRATDARKASPELAAELFGVADLLASQPALRNALADPTVADDLRRDLAGTVFGSKLSADAAAVVTEAAALHWPNASGLVAVIERQALRTLLSHAQAGGKLDTVEEELFRFSRAVVAGPGLRQALDDRRAPGTVRAELAGDLLAGKVDPTTVELAKRAAASPSRPLEASLEEYLKLAAAMRQRAIATVTVARPLPADQSERLQAALVRQLVRPVNLQVVVDPGVIGGVRVQVGDEVIEGTIAARLAAAESELTK